MLNSYLVAGVVGFSPKASAARRSRAGLTSEAVEASVETRGLNRRLATGAADSLSTSGELTSGLGEVTLSKLFDNIF